MTLSSNVHIDVHFYCRLKLLHYSYKTINVFSRSGWSSTANKLSPLEIAKYLSESKPTLLCGSLLDLRLLYNTHGRESKIRTNIVLDDKLIQRAQKLTGIKTKHEVVHEALRLLIFLKEQAEVRDWRGKLPWDGNLNEQRVG